MKADVIAAFIFLLVSIIMYFESLKYSEMGSIFPRIGAAGLFLFSIIYFAMSIKGEKKEYFSRNSIEAFIFTFIGTVMYVGLITYLGFLLSGFLYIALFSYLSSPERTWRILLVSIGFSVSINVLFYLVFRFIFNVPLPSGLLGMLGV